ncbi:MAG: BlaI/MecI/CopY family transcriptional regulator [Gemmataceae bacterium]
MARTPRDITDTELSVLHFLWDEGPATIRRLADALYPRGGAAQYATVQKLLERLEVKGCVRRDRARRPRLPGDGRSRRAGRPAPRAGRPAALRRLVDAVADPLVQTGKLSAEERQSLRRLIDDLDRDPKKPRRGKERS